MPPKSSFVNGKRIARPNTLAAYVMQFPVDMSAAEVVERVQASGRFADKTITLRTVYRIRWAYAATTVAPAAAAPVPAAPPTAADEDMRFIIKRGTERIRAALAAVEKRLGVIGGGGAA